MKQHYTNLFIGSIGVTLVELTVAVVMSSTMIIIVYTTWNMLNHHMFSQQRKAALHGECERIAKTVTTQLRRADAVLQWDRNSIRFISSGFTDTITYSYNGTLLDYNAQPISLTLPRASVTEFSFENQNADEASVPYLFLFTITLISGQGDTATVRSTVMVHRLNEQPEGNDFMW
jgi:Tfp pilus assembly protein PilE